MVEIESASEAEMDIMIAKWNGRVAKERAKSQASYDRMLGENYQSAGKYGALSTILQSATSVGLQTFGGTPAPKSNLTEGGYKGARGK
jgi:hypothetical protein